jgi:lipopolysaccharide export LptBFGC system permease protein LptF
MSVTHTPSNQNPRPGFPVELINVGLFALGILLVVAIGAFLSERIVDESPWLFAAAYAVPATIAFGAYWLIARKLKP